MTPKPEYIRSDFKNTFCFTFHDLRILMDTMDVPCVLINYEDGKIILSNYKFDEFSQYPNIELINGNITDIVTGLRLSDLNGEFEGRFPVNRKLTSEVTVPIKFQYINQTEKLAIIQIIDNPESEKKEELWLSSGSPILLLIEKLSILSRLDFFHEILKISKEFLLADVIMIYFAQVGENNLEKISVEENKFPPHISKIEDQKINGIDYWEPGRRVLTEIHRAGRNERIIHLYSIRFGHQEENSGILVLGYREDKNNIINQIQITLFAEWVIKIFNLHSNLLILQKDNSDIKRKSDLYTRVFDYAFDSILIIDSNNKIINFNNKFCDLFSYSPIELFKKDIGIILGNSILKIIEKSNERDSNQTKIYESVFYDRLGYQVPIQVRILNQISDTAENRILIIRNVKELFEYEKAKVELSKKAALGEVISEFAHEVKNQINNITTGLQLFTQKLDPGDSNLEIINRMQDDCVRISYLMESILTFSRQRIEKFEKVDLNQFLNHIIYQMKHKIEKQGHQIMYHSETTSATIKADIRSLEQVFINLMNNSAEALQDEKGIIAVNLNHDTQRSDYYQIKIADTGPGIPIQIEKNLFEPFVSNKSKGTGLGLAICKRIIESHNGWINVESFPGGTIFSIHLPKITEEH